MDGRIGHFSYLIEEVESDFFQKTAEEIAIVSHEEEAKTFPEVPGRFQKLATLVYQSNQHGLTKQASEDIFLDMSSYENILNKVAASAYWEPLGMTKSAMDFLTVLEEAGVDEDELEKFAEYILEDSIGTDALIEASMEKEAGDGRPIEEIYDELVKEAVALGALSIPFSRAARAIGRGVGRGAKQLFADRPGAGKGLFARWGKATQALGVRKPISQVATAIPRKIKAEKSRILGKWRGSGLQARRTRLNELRKQMISLRGQLKAAKPGTGQAEEIGSRIKDLNKLIAHQRQRVRTQIGKIRKGQATSNIEKIPGRATPPPPKKPPKVTEEGAEKAREAATPPPKTEAPKTEPAPKAPEPTGAPTPKPKGERDPAQVYSKDYPQNIVRDKQGPTRPGEQLGTERKPPRGTVSTEEAAKGARETEKELREAGVVGGGGKAPTRAEVEIDKQSARNRKILEEKKLLESGEKGVTPEAPPARTRTTERDSGYREKRKGPEKAPDEKAPAERPPKEDIEGKGPGVWDAWTKWGKEGWGGLTDVEKSRLIRAGVAAGAGAAAYKTVFGD